MTNGIGFLPQCDQIVVMVDGKISEIGTYAKLIDSDGAFAEFIRTFTNVQEDEEGDPGNQIIHDTVNLVSVTVLELRQQTKSVPINACILPYMLVFNIAWSQQRGKPVSYHIKYDD